MSDKVNLNRKYDAVRKRSFNTKLELFLFAELKESGKIKGKNIKERTFLEFKLDKNLAEGYEKSWQEKEINGIDANEFDIQIEDWYKDKGNLDLKKKLFDAYVIHFKEVFPMNEFENFYEERGVERKCSYCGINEAEILKLGENGLIKTKRNRGKQMEIDRKNSNMEYSKSNVVLACYWCNNAKTDEFSREEFESVGKEIAKIWSNRINKINVQ